MQFVDVLVVLAVMAYAFVIWKFLDTRSPRFHYLAANLSETKGTNREMWIEIRLISAKLAATIFILACLAVILSVIELSRALGETHRVSIACFFIASSNGILAIIAVWTPSLFFQIFRNTEES